jgi:hypothetical protein
MMAILCLGFAITYLDAAWYKKQTLPGRIHSLSSTWNDNQGLPQIFDGAPMISGMT